MSKIENKYKCAPKKNIYITIMVETHFTWQRQVTFSKERKINLHGNGIIMCNRNFLYKIMVDENQEHVMCQVIISRKCLVYMV